MVDIEVAAAVVRDMLLPVVVDLDIDQVVVAVVVVHTVVAEHIDLAAVVEHSWQDRHIVEAVHIPQRLVVADLAVVHSRQHFPMHPLYNTAAAVVQDWQR